MTPRHRAVLQVFALLLVVFLLIVLFLPAVALVEAAARQLRYLWWLILLVALAVWLIWGFRRRP